MSGPERTSQRELPVAGLTQSGERPSQTNVEEHDAHGTLPRGPTAPSPPPPPPPRSGPAPAMASPDRASPALPPPPISARQRAAMRLPLVQRDAYVIEGEFARGAIGRILRARDRRLGRLVAIKELLPEHGKEEERFVREALLTSRLEHPSIVPVHEAGRWPTGEPFYAMKLVVGRSLDAILGEARTIEDRVALLRHVLPVAEAIAYAHSQRIIHRDLKPSNVLVGAFGETVVIDWGLAKDMSEEVSDPNEHTPTWRRGIPIVQTEEGLTMLGEVMGTPAYMPPEQARGFPVDERADVYAVGAILYHLLSGHAPYEGRPQDVVRQVVHDLPIPLDRRQAGLPPDLVAIVKKAMARSPLERYRSAQELADDLRNYMVGAAVRAHTYTTSDRFWRFVRRYQAPVAIAAGATLLLALGGGYAARRVWSEQGRAQEKAREAAEAQRQAAARADDLVLAEARGAVDRDPNRAIVSLAKLSPDFARWHEVRLIASEARAAGLSKVLVGHDGAVTVGATLPSGALVTGGDDHKLRVWGPSGSPRVLAGHGAEIVDLATSADGAWLVTGGKDRAVRLWSTTGPDARVLVQLAQPAVRVAIAADGHAVASRAKGDLVRLTDVASTTTTPVSDVPSEDADLAFAPSGKLLAFSVGGRLMLREEGAPPRVLAAPGKPVTVSTFGDKGDVLATGSVDGTVRLWDVAKGSFRDLEGHTGAVVALAFAPGGALVSASTDRTLRVWDAAKGTVRVLQGHKGDVLSLRLSPDGARAVTASADHTVRVWNLADGSSDELHGFDDVAAGAAFSADGRHVAAWSWDHTARVWDLDDRGARVLSTHEGAATHVAFAGDAVASIGEDRATRIARVGGGAIVVRARTNTTALAASRTAIAVGGEDGTVQLLATDGRELHVLRGHGAAVRTLAFSADGARLASAGADRTAAVWDVASGHRPSSFESDGEVLALAFSPDGKRLAGAGSDHTVRVWPLEGGAVQAWTGQAGAIHALAFAPDGKTLASAGTDRTIARWDVASGRAKFLDGGVAGVARVAFFPDGATFASAGGDPALRLWDAGTGAPRAVLRGHTSAIGDFAIAPDGTRVATASADHTVRVWDVESGGSRVLSHAGEVVAVGFSPDGKWVASASRDHTVRLWADDLPSDALGLRAWIAARIPASP